MNAVGIGQVIGMSLSWAFMLLAGGVAMLLMIRANARGRRTQSPGTFLVAMIAVGSALIFSMFSGGSPRSARVTPSVQSAMDNDVPRSSKAVSTAHATESFNSHVGDDHQFDIGTTTDIGSGAGDENFGLVITSKGESRTISLGQRARRLGPRLSRVGSRMRQLGQRLHARLDGTIGPNGTKWLISGGAVLALMFVGYVALSAAARGRFSWSLRVLSAMAFASIIAGVAAVRHAL